MSEVVFQDDCVKGWAALFGGQVHSSGIGGLKSRLKSSLEAPVVVERTEPTTQECFVCGKRQELSLSDRDVNATLVILRKGLGLGPDQAVGLDRPELKPCGIVELIPQGKPLEREAAARILGSTPYIRVSFPQ